MRPTELPAPRGVPVIATPAVRHQPAPEALAQQLLGPVATARPPDHKHGDPLGHCPPEPGPLQAFPRPGFVRVRRRLALHRRPCLGHGFGHRLGGRLLQLHDGAQPHLDPQEIMPQPLRGPLRQVIGPCGQRRRGLEAGAKAVGRHARRHLRRAHFATGRTDQRLQLILGDDRLHRRHLCHLLPLGLGIFPLPGRLATGAPLWLDEDHCSHLFHEHQRPSVSLMARLAPRATATRLSPRNLARGLGRIARRWTRRVPGVLLYVLGQMLNRRL